MVMTGGTTLPADAAQASRNQGEKGMNATTRARYEARAEILKALAHPTRLFMAEQLSRGERCVCDLTDMVGADMSTVSKHLAVMKRAGVVVDEKRGSQVFYSLRLTCVLNFLRCAEEVLKADARDRTAAAR